LLTWPLNGRETGGNLAFDTELSAIVM